MIKVKSDYQKGIIALVFLAFLFASMGIFARYLNTGFALFQQVYLRILAGFFLGLFFFSNDLDISKIKKITTKEWFVLLFRSVTNYVLGVTLFTQAILITKYSNVSFIIALPVVALFGILFLGETLTKKKAFLLFFSFLGVMLIAVRDYRNIFLWGNGEILALLSSISFAFTYISRRWQSNLLNNKEITMLIFVISFVFLFLLSLCFGEGVPVSGWTSGLFFVVCMAGLFSVVGLFLINYGFEKVEAILANNLLMLESVFAIILGFLFYQEIPTIKELLGGMLIVVSVLLMNKEK